MSRKARWALYGLVIPLSIASALLAVALLRSVSAGLWLPTMIWLALTLGAFFVLGLVFHWFPDTANDEEYELYLQTGDPVHFRFCEAYEDSWVKQPVSVWTDLAFVVVGLAVVLIAGTRPAAAPNPMADPSSPVPLVYGLAVIFMGPGSMYFHASMKAWAAWFDNMSIIFWAAFSMSYTWIRLIGAWFAISADFLWIVFGVVVIIVGLSTFVSENVRRTSQVIVVGLWFVVEFIFAGGIWLGYGPGLHRDTNWFLGALIAFGLAFGAWIPSGGVNRSLCKPDSPFQGHGFWHLFTAIGALLVYMYFVSEFV